MNQSIEDSKAKHYHNTLRRKMKQKRVEQDSFEKDINLKNRFLTLKEELGLGAIASCLPFYKIKLNKDNIKDSDFQKRTEPIKISTHKFKIQHPLVEVNKQVYSQSVRDKPNNF